jgi:hypothetical protein
MQRRGTVRTPLRHGGFTKVPDDCRECNFRYEQSVFKSHEAFQLTLCLPPFITAYYLLSNGPSFVNVDV